MILSNAARLVSTERWETYRISWEKEGVVYHDKSSEWVVKQGIVKF